MSQYTPRAIREYAAHEYDGPPFRYRADMRLYHIERRLELQRRLFVFQCIVIPATGALAILIALLVGYFV